MYPWVSNNAIAALLRASTYDAQGVGSMGRGRQKAKQTKVARDLKYYSPPTDLTALQRELQSSADREEADDEDVTDGGRADERPAPRLPGPVPRRR